MTDGPQAKNQVPENAARGDFLTRGMSWWYGRLGAHRVALTVVLVALGVFFYRSSAGIHWAANALLYFSGHSKIVRDLRAASRQPGLANDLRLDAHFAAGRQGDLAAAVRRLRRACLHTGQFARVWAGVSMSAQSHSQVALAQLGPVLLNAAQFNQMRRRLSAAWLDRHFKSVAARLQDPDGQVLAAELQADPLALGDLYLKPLTQLNPLPGAHFAHGLLVSSDARHALMVLAPRVAPENVAASETMLRQLRTAIARVQHAMPTLRVWVIGTAVNYVSNQRRALRDVVRISLVGTLLVAAAILLFFRRGLTVLICMIPPAVGVGTTMGIAGLLHLNLPLIVLGFSGLICGSTTDYGIQLIAAVKRRVRRGESPGLATVTAATREMFGPISMSVCTSVTGYGALTLSSAPGLRALGIFVAVATLCIWLVTFLVLPVYLGTGIVDARRRQRAADENSGPVATSANPAQSGPSLGELQPIHTSASSAVKKFFVSSRPSWFGLGMVTFLAVTALLAWHATQVKYSYHGTFLDGSAPQVLQQEEQFSHTWGDVRRRGVVVITDSSPMRALERLQTLTGVLRTLKKAGWIENYYTPAAILPDDRQVKRRWARWRKFWNPRRQAKANHLIAQAAAQAGLRPEAFSASLAAWAAPRIIPAARRRLENSPAALIPDSLLVTSSGVTLTAAVEPNLTLPPARQHQWAAKLWRACPRAEIISGGALFYHTTHRAAAEMKHLLPVVALLIFTPLWFYFRRPGLTLIAGLSLAVGFIWLLGVAQWFAGGLNLLSLVPILFTMGVAVDYGIYAAADPARRLAGGAGVRMESRNPATFLCAATTILGTGAMLVVSYPALHWIGLTLTAGITGGYLASLFLVGPLTRIFHR